MSNQAVWDEKLSGATIGDVILLASQAPKVLTEVSVADSDEVTRDTGLLLTKKELIDLRKYEAAGLALPTAEQDVRYYLGFGDEEGGGKGLQVPDFVRTFNTVSAHAKRWAPLREDIMLTSTDLHAFAAEMQVYLGTMEEIREEARGMKLLDDRNVTTLEQLYELKLELGGRFPGIELESAAVADVKYVLGEILKKIETNRSRVAGIKKSLDSFSRELSEKVIPEIQLRAGLIDVNSLPDVVKQLQASINKRAEELELKNKQYKDTVRKAIESAVSMQVAGLVMAIYQGVEAENIRKQRDALNAEQEAEIQKLAAKNQTLASLSRIRNDLSALVILSVDAEVATKNLQFVWNTLQRYINNSSDEAKNITDTLSLRRFMTHFRLVAEPWKKILVDSNALIKVFKDADEEYLIDYKKKTSGKGSSVSNFRIKAMNNFRVTGLSGTQDYPSVNLGEMANSHKDMKQLLNRARVIHVRTEYLPNVNQRITDMVNGVSDCAAELQRTAAEVKGNLQHAVSKLNMFEAELAEAISDGEDADVIEEIMNECAQVLANGTALASNGAKDLGKLLVKVETGIDRNVMKGHTRDAEQEKETALAQQESLEKSLLASQNELEVLTKGIESLNNQGPEKISDDTPLDLGKLKEIGVSSPELMLVKMALDQLKATIEELGREWRFYDLIRARDVAFAKEQNAVKEVIANEQRIKLFDDKAKFIKAVESLDDQRQRFVPELRKAIRGFEQFPARVKVLTQNNQEAGSGAFTKEVNTFNAFIAPLSLPR